MKKKIEFIAERELFEDGSGEIVTVRIGKPEKIKKEEYVCAFQIAGLGRSRVQHAHGGDEFQALMLAMEGIRGGIEASGKKFRWVGGEEGDHGFPRSVPAFFGLEFAGRINKMIDREIGRFSKKAKNR